MGRPTRYKPKLALTICERLMDGDSLRTICQAEDMPHRATVFRWLLTREDFRDQYARAREVQAECWADESVDISDDGTNDWQMKYGRGPPDENGAPQQAQLGWQVNHEYIQRSKLRVETRQWALEHLLPKKYGKKVDHTLGDGQGGPAKLVLEFVSAAAVPEEA